MIQALSTKNFKSFKELSLVFKPLTVLCGVNGSGKSSLIQLLLLLKENVVSGGKSIDVPFAGRCYDIGRQRDVLYKWTQEYRCEISVEGKDQSLSFYADMPESQWSFDYAQFQTKEEGNGNLVDCLKQIKYLSADRLAPRQHHQNSYYAIRDMEIGRYGENAVAMLARYGNNIVPQELCHDFCGSDDDDESTKGILSYQVNAWMQEISHGVSVKAVPKEDIVDLEVRYSSGDTAVFRPQNVGFGISYVLPVLVMILTAKRGDCLLIENPGAHLHPRGQSALGRLLVKAASHGIQIIIETHSDHVVNGIRVGCKKCADEHPEECAAEDDVKYYGGAIINFFERVVAGTDDLAEQYTQVTPIRIEADGELECYPAGFLDEWPHQMGELA